MTRYFYDCEFLEDGHTIDLISIGIVAEDGREYYAVNADADMDTIKNHPWLVANVLPHLPMNNRGPLDRVADGGRPPSREELEIINLDHTRTGVKPKWKIASEVSEFLTVSLDEDDEVELWANYPAYDHVVLMWLWGPMVSKPEGLPMRTRDLQDFADHLGMTADDLPAQQDGEHHALADARYDRDLWLFLDEHARRDASV